MHDESFVFLPGCGEKLERSIWNQGVYTWIDFLSEEEIPGMSWLTKKKHDQFILNAHIAAKSKDACWFEKNWQKEEQWRLWQLFCEDALFLDIETGPYRDVTVVGAMKDGETYELVAGTNLNPDLIMSLFHETKLLVTFNGRSFDWPVLQKKFGLPPLRIPHLDLRGACTKVGLIGGLKHIEKEIGIVRDWSIQGFDGMDASDCFEQYARTQKEEELELLLDYNRADAVNLKELAEYVIPRLWNKTRFENLKKI